MFIEHLSAVGSEVLFYKMLVSCCGQSVMTVSNTCAEPRSEKQMAPMCEGKATVLRQRQRRCILILKIQAVS